MSKLLKQLTRVAKTWQKTFCEVRHIEKKFIRGKANGNKIELKPIGINQLLAGSLGTIETFKLQSVQNNDCLRLIECIL